MLRTHAFQGHGRGWIWPLWAAVLLTADPSLGTWKSALVQLGLCADSRGAQMRWMIHDLVWHSLKKMTDDVWLWLIMCYCVLYNVVASYIYIYIVYISLSQLCIISGLSEPLDTLPSLWDPAVHRAGWLWLRIALRLLRPGGQQKLLSWILWEAQVAPEKKIESAHLQCRFTSFFLSIVLCFLIL